MQKILSYSSAYYYKINKTYCKRLVNIVKYYYTVGSRGDKNWINEEKIKIVSISVHAIVALILAVIMIALCFKNSNGEYYDLLINKALSKSINGNWAKTSFAFIFSIIAEYPAYFILPVFAVMLFYCDDLIPQKWRKIFKLAMAGLSVIGWVILCFKSEVADMIQATGFDGMKFYLLMGILAICAAALGLYLGKFIPKKTRYILFKFAILQLHI